MGYRIDVGGYCVYSLWGASTARPFYVGMTSRLFGRLGSHMTNPTVRRRLRYVLVEHVESREAAAALERELIEKYHPLFNLQHNTLPRRRPLNPSDGSSKRSPWNRIVLPDFGDESDDEDDDEFLPLFCPLCGSHHHPADPHRTQGDEA